VPSSAGWAAAAGALINDAAAIIALIKDQCSEFHLFVGFFSGYQKIAFFGLPIAMKKWNVTHYAI
jgi:hypothetical protein